MNAPTVLVILDGFGYRKESKYNAIAQAHTPTIQNYFKKYPHAILSASGNAVGLLPNYIGNSQVGHLTIGTGRIIEQPATHIHQAIDDGSFFTNKVLINDLKKLHQNGKTLHIMGLLSDAGVHAHEKHLYAFLKAAQKQGIKNIVVHAFLDGRDVAPQSARIYLQKLTDYIAHHQGITLGSITGRFYAMDRDKNWTRTDATVEMLTKQHHDTKNWQQELEYNYQKNIFDEFIPPIALNSKSTINDGDAIIFFNFRPDRARQLTRRLHNRPLTFLLTPVAYTDAPVSDVMFATPKITNTLLDVLHQQNKSIFVIAETEKYAHVTYFFSGGREQPLPNETRILIPSIPAKNYVDQPCMSALKITQMILDSLRTAPKDFYLINYANADMVGHSGTMSATVKAIECLDIQLKQLYDQIIEKMNGTLYITADHGNAEIMFDEKSGQPQTAHTTSPVPFIMINKNIVDKKLNLKQLSDIAPFILHNMHIEVPKEMQK